MRTRAFAAVLLVAVSACYKYVPVEVSGPPPGARAHIVLSDAGTVEMARWVGPGTRAIEGEVVSADASGVTLAVRRIEKRDGIEEFWKGESVTIPRGAVSTYTERRLSRSRTALFSAGVLGVALAVGQAFGDISGILGRGGSGPGSEK